VLAPHPDRPDLTDREMQVLRGMANGQENPEIAAALFVSVNTVKTHISRIQRKLGTSRRPHTVAVAFCWRLLTPQDVPRPASTRSPSSTRTATAQAS
jgi:DNA-binding CsgD family transcriptional regulator